jgi:hypothetical protein
MAGVLAMKIKLERGESLQDAVDQVVRETLATSRITGTELDDQVLRAPWLQPYLNEVTS